MEKRKLSPSDELLLLAVAATAGEANTAMDKQTVDGLYKAGMAESALISMLRTMSENPATFYLALIMHVEVSRRTLQKLLRPENWAKIEEACARIAAETAKQLPF